MTDSARSADPDRWVADVLDIALHRFLGVHLLDPRDPARGLLLPVAAPSLNQAGLLHGGIVSALLDVAAFVALRPTLSDGQHAVTHAISVQLLRPVGPGAEVHFEGEVLQLGRQVAFLRAEARVEGAVVAVAQITKSRVGGATADTAAAGLPVVA